MANKPSIRGFNAACLGVIGTGIFLKLLESPAGSFGNDFVAVVRQPLQ